MHIPPLLKIHPEGKVTSLSLHKCTLEEDDIQIMWFLLVFFFLFGVSLGTVVVILTTAADAPQS